MKSFIELLIYFTGLICFISYLAFGNTFVKQVNIFSGETASNLTHGAPLVVSSSGTVNTGINYTELGFSSTITTTSSSNSVMTGMTTTPTSGVYLVVFSTWLTNTTGNQKATISVFAGGSQITNSIRTGAPFNGALGSANDGMPISTNAIVSVNGSQAISIEWNTTGGTLSAANGMMDLVRLQ